eukprot:scaffold275771_cov28-Tisochrysis_lutea.AAC.1
MGCSSCRTSVPLLPSCSQPSGSDRASAGRASAPDVGPSSPDPCPSPDAHRAASVQAGERSGEGICSALGAVGTRPSTAARRSE